MISSSLRQFIGHAFPTVAHLEAALYFRARPADDHSCEQAARALYLSPAQGEELLQHLCGIGILAESGHDSFRWAPRDAAIAAAMDEAVRAYHADLRAITALIHDRHER